MIMYYGSLNELLIHELEGIKELRNSGSTKIKM